MASSLMCSPFCRASKKSKNDNYHAVLFCVVLCCAVLCCVVLCCAMLCCVVLCCVTLRHVVYCCIVLCNILLRCMMLEAKLRHVQLPCPMLHYSAFIMLPLCKFCSHAKSHAIAVV